VADTPQAACAVKEALVGGNAQAIQFHGKRQEGSVVEGEFESATQLRRPYQKG